jgi:hypothetical protein
VFVGDGMVPGGSPFHPILTRTCPPGTHLVDFGGFVASLPSSTVWIGTTTFGETGELFFRNPGDTPTTVGTWSKCTVV